MGLCLHVFGQDAGEDDPEEIAECDVSHYNDFKCCHLDARRFPRLMDHSDSDGEWTLAEIPVLERELTEIGAAFKRLPPTEPQGAFVAADLRGQSRWESVNPVPTLSGFEAVVVG